MLQTLLLLLSLQALPSPNAITISELYASRRPDPIGDWLELANQTKEPLQIEHLTIVLDKNRRKKTAERLDVAFDVPLSLSDFLVISSEDWLFPFDGLINRESFLIEPRLKIKTRGAQQICVIVNQRHEACVDTSLSNRFIQHHALSPYPGVKGLMKIEMCETMPGYFITPGLAPEFCLSTDLSSKHAPSILLSEGKTLSIIDDDPNDTFLISFCRGSGYFGICNILQSLRTSKKDIYVENVELLLPDFIRVQDSFGFFEDFKVPKSQTNPELRACSFDKDIVSVTLFLPENFTPINFRVIESGNKNTIHSGAFLYSGNKTISWAGPKSHERYKLQLAHRQGVSILDIC